MEEMNYSNRNVSSDEDFSDQKLKTCVFIVKAKLKSLNVAIPNHCDQFIARCVRVKNYDAEKATHLFINFGYMMRMSAMRDLHENFKPSELKDLYLTGTATPLLKRDSLGRLIIVGRAKSWNPAEFDFDKTLAGLIVLMNYGIARSKEIQNSGVVFVLDCKDWTVQQVRSVKISRLKLAVKLMQNSSPGKLKGFHFIHHPKVVTVFFLLVKPFLKAKLASRIHFHRNEESLNNVFGSHFYSETLTGIDNGDDGIIDTKLLLDLSQSNDYYQEMVQCGYPAY